MTNNLKYSTNGLAITQHFEGYRDKAYQDSTGRWTIGYGHTDGVSPDMTCTQLQATQWLMEDVSGAEYAVNRMVTTSLNQNQFDALVDFVFNLGSGNLNGSTLLRLLNNGDFAGASEEFPKWNHAGGVVVNGLTLRRLAEQKLFNTPVSDPATTDDTVSKVVNQIADLVKQLQDKFSS